MKKCSDLAIAPVPWSTIYRRETAEMNLPSTPVGTSIKVQAVRLHIIIICPGINLPLLAPKRAAFCGRQITCITEQTSVQWKYKPVAGTGQGQKESSMVSCTFC